MNLDKNAKKVIFFFLLLLILFLFFYSKFETSNITLKNDSPSINVKYDDVKSYVDKKNEIKGARDRLSKTSLVSEINKNTDQRSIFETLKNRPTEGGIYYAEHILKQCKFLLGLVESYQEKYSDASISHLTETKKIYSQNLIKNKCQSFLKNDFLSFYDDQKIKVSKGTDPLFDISQGLDKAIQNNEQDQLRKILEKVLHLKDPVFFSVEGMRLLRHDGFLWFSGQSYPLEYKELILAMSLIPCDLGLECGNAHPFVVNTCLQKSHCYDGLEELVFKEEVNNDEIEFQTIQRYRRSLALAIVNQDVDAFIPLHKRTNN